MPPGTGADVRLVGRRIRHERRARRMTLADLAAAVGSSPSHLSQIENGHRQPTLRMLAALGAAFELPAGELLNPQPPSRREALEIAVERAQAEPLYRALDLPPLRPGRRLPTAALEHIAGLYDALRSRCERVVCTPEEAREANRRLRGEMRERDNYFPHLEELARRTLDAVGYRGPGALPEHVLLDVAAHCGFRLSHVPDLPRSVRSVADLRHRRIYLAQGGRTGGHDTRSVLLQTLAAFVIGHGTPVDFADYLRQRTEANYFAAAVLVPERAAVPLLRRAARERSLAVEDVRERFGVSYEMAAHRFTNLATRHLGLRVHFVRTDEDGRIYKAYENDGVAFPADATGAIEGQRACRQWAARRVPGVRRHEQYTDTPAGTYWCSARDAGGGFAVTVGVPFEDSKWFRGRETAERRTSGCPDPSCCARPPGPLAARWDRMAWPSARAQSHVLAALPPGVFPGVDLTDVYEFLDRHAAER